MSAHRMGQYATRQLRLHLSRTESPPPGHAHPRRSPVAIPTACSAGMVLVTLTLNSRRSLGSSCKPVISTEYKSRRRRPKRQKPHGQGSRAWTADAKRAATGHATRHQCSKQIPIHQTRGGIPIRLAVANALDSTLDAHLAAQRFPVEEKGGAGIGEKVAGHAAFEAGIENKIAGRMGLQQHHAHGRLPVYPTVASAIAFESLISAARASANQTSHRA